MEKIEGFEIVYFELLSLVHLMMASLVFIMLISILLTIKVVTLHEKKHVINDNIVQ